MSKHDTRIIAVMNQQAMTGKTRLAAGLGQALAEAGQKILLIDMSPQGDLTNLLTPADKGIGDVMQDADWSEAVVAQSENFLFAGYQGLSEFELGANNIKSAYALRRRLHDAPFTNFVLIDTASRKGLLSMSVLLAVDDIVIPVSSSSRSIEGVQSLIHVLKRVEKQRGSPLRLWLALVNWDAGEAMNQMVQVTLGVFFPDRLLSTIIPAEDGGRVAAAYAELAEDLIEGRTFHG